MGVDLVPRWRMPQEFVAAWVTEETCTRMDMIVCENPDRFKDRADFVRSAILSYIKAIKKGGVSE